MDAKQSGARAIQNGYLHGYLDELRALAQSYPATLRELAAAHPDQQALLQEFAYGLRLTIRLITRSPGAPAEQPARMAERDALPAELRELVRTHAADELVRKHLEQELIGILVVPAPDEVIHFNTPPYVELETMAATYPEDAALRNFFETVNGIVKQ